MTPYQRAKIEKIISILSKENITIQEASRMADKALEPVRDRLKNLGVEYV